MKFFLTAVLIFAGVFPSLAWAKPEEKVTTRYYTLEGSRKKDLIKELKTKGVKDKGARFHAHTDWRVTWNYRYVPVQNGCKIHSVTVNLEISYFLPKWTPGPEASSELIKKWEAYNAALKVHEEGHADIGRRAALEIESSLLRLGQGVSCGAIQDSVSGETAGILNQYHEEEARYDRSTKNGRTQGAALD